MEQFEVVKRFKESEINIPKRSTAFSAGYDLEAAEDIIVPSFFDHYYDMFGKVLKDNRTSEDEAPELLECYSLEKLSDLTKELQARPTLIPTGLKCKLDPNHYLELVSRSSVPLKNWLICANSCGIIDSDYYGNPDNDGELFFQVINFSPVPIIIKKGDRICQAIVKEYLTLNGDDAKGERTGGFGSTNE